MTKIIDLFDDKLHEAEVRYNVKLYTKDEKWSWMWKAIHVFLRVVSFGKMDDFYDRFTTTIGNRIFLHAGWQKHKIGPSDYALLCHELVHVKQADKYGMVLMSILYNLLPFPIGLAYFRYLFEREAYVESYNAAKEVGQKPNINRYVELMTGPSYLWAWPFKTSVRKWFAEHCNPD